VIITYEPEGGDAHRWDLTEIRILATEAEAVERVTDLDWTAARTKVVKGSMLALRAVAWVLMKRTQADLRYSAFVPAASELGWEYSKVERAEIRKAVEENPDIEPEQKAALLAEFDEADALLDEDEHSPGGNPETVPKASAVKASRGAG
jgi:hypothetical protein